MSISVAYSFNIQQSNTILEIDQYGTMIIGYITVSLYMIYNPTLCDKICWHKIVFGLFPYVGPQNIPHIKLQYN